MHFGLGKWLVGFEQFLLVLLDVLLGVGIGLLHALVGAEEAGTQTIRFLLAGAQIRPARGLLRSLQLVLHPLDLLLKVGRLPRPALLLLGGRQHLHPTEIADEVLLLRPQILRSGAQSRRGSATMPGARRSRSAISRRWALRDMLAPWTACRTDGGGILARLLLLASLPARRRQRCRRC